MEGKTSDVVVPVAMSSEEMVLSNKVYLATDSGFLLQVISKWKGLLSLMNLQNKFPREKLVSVRNLESLWPWV